MGYSEDKVKNIFCLHLTKLRSTLMLFSKKMLIAVAALVVLSVPTLSFAASQDGMAKDGTMMKEGMTKDGTMMKDDGMMKKQ